MLKILKRPLLFALTLCILPLGWSQTRPQGERRAIPGASVYVPLDLWVYAAFDRLAALGYVPSGFAGMRPWTRSECVRLLREAGDLLARDESAPNEAWRMYRALTEEFAEAREGNFSLRLESVYVRSLGIAGSPLRDGYHLGQTLINDYGRPYAEGFNLVTGASLQAGIGPFVFYTRGELQHWPSAEPEPLSVRQAVAAADYRLVLPGSANGADRFRLLDSYVAFSIRNVQVSFGKQSLWLGPDEGGPLLFSNNAEPVWMLQVNRVSPWALPGVKRVLGPLRWQFFLGQLAGHQFVFSSPTLYGPKIDPQPYIHGEKISFHPTPNFEFGMGVTTVFGGPGMPFTGRNFLRTFDWTNQNAGTAGDAGDHRSSFDFRYRVPGLRHWLVLYNDALVEDEASPLGSSRPSMHPGIYLPQVPYLPKLELRLEGVYSDVPGQRPAGPIYFNARYRSGYTNYGNLLASWIGRQGRGGQAWTTYWFTPRTRAQLFYRHMEVDRVFLEGGHLNDLGVHSEVTLRRSLVFSSLVQYEHWAFPLLASRPRSNVSMSVQLTFFPQKNHQ